MLLAENRGWAEDGDLPAVLHHLERRADRNLCLAESHVATHQAVHGPWKLEVTLGVLNRQVVARGLHPWEGLLHFQLEGSVRRERAAVHQFALGVQLDEVAGELLRLLLGFSQRALPLTSCELVQLGLSVSGV